MCAIARSPTTVAPARRRARAASLRSTAPVFISKLHLIFITRRQFIGRHGWSPRTVHDDIDGPGEPSMSSWTVRGDCFWGDQLMHDSAMPCMWKSDVKCFLDHINMTYSVSFRASRGRGFPPSRTHPLWRHSGLAFAAAITAAALISASALGLTAPLQKSRRRPCVCMCVCLFVVFCTTRI